jgi:hypothetical protein
MHLFLNMLGLITQAQAQCAKTAIFRRRESDAHNAIPRIKRGGGVDWAEAACHDFDSVNVRKLGLLLVSVLGYEDHVS